MKTRRTDYGFEVILQKSPPLQVECTATLHKDTPRELHFLRVYTEKEELDIRVTATGLIRVHHTKKTKLKKTKA